MQKTEIAIIGGGISGLSALHFIRTMKPEREVHLYEAQARLGGTIGTDHIDGYSLDWGPNGFLDREPLTLRLSEELGLKESLERAGENVSNRYILRGGKLRAVPMSPLKFMMADILPVMGRLRVMGEPFARKRAEGIDESIYDFVRRRIGTDAADYLVQPMVSGVYGGVASKLSLKSCFPIMREMEDEYGSLFKAMIAKAKKARAKGKSAAGPSGPGGWLTSFEGGTDRIIKGFEEKYDKDITKEKRTISITKQDDVYQIKMADGTVVESKSVILALPANNASSIVGGLSPELSAALGEIRYAPIAVICLGYDKKKIGCDLNGFGFLVPSKENRKILGSIWTSSIFKNRAPEGMVQLRTMVGGDGDHASAELSDDDLLQLVTNDLNEIMKIDGKPDMVKMYRWKHGIPQFRIGHSDVVKRIENATDALGSLFVTGNAYYGIGLNDCVKQSYKVASAL